MTPSKELHSLIKSLSINEKRYFKIFAERHVIGGKNNYIKLFDFIEKQKEYDEAEVKKAFSNEVFIKHLPSEKNYLFNLILRSLEGFHAKTDLENELRSDLLHVKILFEKRLFDSCKKIVKKAIETTRKFEMNALAIEFVKWELRILRNEYFHLTREELNEKQDLLFDCIDKERNFQQFARLQSNFALLHNQHPEPRSEAELKPFEKLMSNPLLENETNAITTNAKTFYYLLWSIYYSFKCDYKQFVSNSQKIIELIEANAHLSYLHMLTYHTSLFNIGSGLISLKDFEKVPPIINKLKSEETKAGTGRTKKILFFHILNLELMYNNAAGKLDKNRKIINDVESELLEESPSDSRLHFAYVNMGISCFLRKDYKDAKRFMHYIINNEHIDKERENYFLAMLISFMVNVELKDESLIESSGRSLTRFLHKRGKLFKVEKALLHFVNKNIYALSEDKLPSGEWKQFKNELEEISKNPFERKLLNQFDLVKWVKEKI